MTDVHILAIDLAKPSFQVCTTALGGAVLFNRTVSRAKFEAVLREQPPCIVAMEARATSHFWGRFAQGFWSLSLDDARLKCEAWRIDYNEVRPHSFLGNQTRMERAFASGQACLP